MALELLGLLLEAFGDLINPELVSGRGSGDGDCDGDCDDAAAPLEWVSIRESALVWDCASRFDLRRRHPPPARLPARLQPPPTTSVGLAKLRPHQFEALPPELCSEGTVQLLLGERCGVVPAGRDGLQVGPFLVHRACSAG